MNSVLEQKLAELPRAPGVYFHKDKTGAIIYVGKAAVLKNRVRQYFQKSRGRDPKTEALVHEITDIDWMVVDSEMEALFLEAELIRRYLPRYNILLRDDKAMSYIRINYDSDYPTVSTVRRPFDDGARYFGPYSSTTAVRQSLKLLRRIFPYATRKIGGQTRATIHYHLGLDPGLEEGKTSLEDYRANLRKLMAIIQGRRKTILKELERDMKRYAKSSRYEEAAKIRNQIYALQGLDRQVIFSDKEFMDISKDHALNELVNLLSLDRYPFRIEGYDISHMQGSDVVASMVVFTNGVSNKTEYRKFKTRINQNNDFYNMNETLKRRLSEKNRKAWGVPSLILIDGGKGQLDAAIQARDEQGCFNIPFIGLAKREEQIVIKKALVKSQKSKVESQPTTPVNSANVGIQSIKHSAEQNSKSTRSPIEPGTTTAGASGVILNEQVLHDLGGYATESDDFILVNLPHTTNVVKLLQRIRDESHRFAVSYHSVLKVKRQTASLLDDVPGVGPATRKKLLRTFGSMRGITQASRSDLQKVVGEQRAAVLEKYLQP